MKESVFTDKKSETKKKKKKKKSDTSPYSCLLVYYPYISINAHCERLSFVNPKSMKISINP